MTGVQHRGCEPCLPSNGNTRNDLSKALFYRQSARATGLSAVPPALRRPGPARHYVEFFAANIRNPNTRRAYARACSGSSAGCVVDHGLTLTTLRPFDVGEWIEQLQEKHGPAGVNQQLAGVRMMFNWLITGQVAPVNPAAVVRDPKLVRGVFALRKGMLETISLSGQARWSYTKTH